MEGGATFRLLKSLKLRGNRFMPKLSQIELYLDGNYSEEDKKVFLFKSRCLCNFWEREISKLKFTSKYSRINVYVTDGSTEIRVQPMKVVPFLEVVVHYPLEKISHLKDSQFQQHYIRILEKALSAAISAMPIPLEQSLHILKQFEANKYENEWVQSEKVSAKKSIESKVIATLSMHEFKLTQFVYLDCKLADQLIIAKTLPRELLFNSYLGKLSISKGNILEYKKGKSTLSQFDLTSAKFI